MQLDMFNYRDYVPAFVLTVEARRIEDILQADFSMPSQAPGGSYAESAQRVIDGLARMVSDFKVSPVAAQVIEQAKAGIQNDLKASITHVNVFNGQLKKLQRLRLRAARRGQANLTRRIAEAIKVSEGNLETSQRVNKAYRSALEALESVDTIKVLTPEQLARLAVLEQDLAALQPLQKETEGVAFEDIPAEFSDVPSRFPRSRLMASTTFQQPRERSAPTGKTVSERIDQKAALAILGASGLGAFFLYAAGPMGCTLGVFVGALLGVALHPWVEARENKA